MCASPAVENPALIFSFLIAWIERDERSQLRCGSRQASRAGQYLFFSNRESARSLFCFLESAPVWYVSVRTIEGISTPPEALLYTSYDLLDIINWRNCRVNASVDSHCFRRIEFFSLPSVTESHGFLTTDLGSSIQSCPFCFSLELPDEKRPIRKHDLHSSSNNKSHTSFCRVSLRRQKEHNAYLIILYPIARTGNVLVCCIQRKIFTLVSFVLYFSWNQGGTSSSSTFNGMW